MINIHTTREEPEIRVTKEDAEIMLANPCCEKRKISDLNILKREEYDKMVKDWNKQYEIYTYDGFWWYPFDEA